MIYLSFIGNHDRLIKNSTDYGATISIFLRYKEEIEKSIKNDHLHLINNNPETPDNLSEIVGDFGIDLAASINADNISKAEMDQLPVHRIGYAHPALLSGFVQEAELAERIERRVVDRRSAHDSACP